MNEFALILHKILDSLFSKVKPQAEIREAKRVVEAVDSRLGLVTERDPWQVLKLTAEIRGEPRKLMKNKTKQRDCSGDCVYNLGIHIWW